ncbi:MAG TPA: hypothetical protein PLO65_03790 [Caulobacter sp.]|nr:hypothetical protein [Caulobacter sp.]
MADGGEAREPPARLPIVSATTAALSAALFVAATALLVGPFAGLSDWSGDGRAGKIRRLESGFSDLVDDLLR